MREIFLVDVDLRRVPSLATDVLVIGSGIAALEAALAAAETASVLIITKAAPEESNTFYAQGGVAASLSPDDDPAKHIQDTLTAGVGLCDEAAVRKMVIEGRERIRELMAWGVPFDRDDRGDIALTIEGGHSSRRVLHADGDATGKVIERTALSRVAAHPNITLMPGVFAVDLLHHERVCYGAVAMETGEGSRRLLRIEARATVMATGGACCIYRETTNPEVATGDGMAMAYRAGATLADMEFVQMHPTTLYLAGARRFLISEAVRGEGAVLVNRRGERFMEKAHPLKDLAPRDVVCRAIMEEMARSGEPNVFLDLSPIPPERIRERFPNIMALCAQYGLDITRDRIPVRPAAHYFMGGVRTGLDAATDVGRLLACGEVACVGVHGANRLASNSLLEGLVFGREAGVNAARIAREPQPGFPERAVRRRFEHKRIPLDVEDVRRSLRSLVSRACGIYRDGESLANAIRMLDFWQQYVYAEEFASPSGFELQNMLQVAQLVARCALAREESRGAHQRREFPATDNARWKRHSLVSRFDFEK
ncbi:MAG: L-aspartate oxidase [Planctomycetota bacterium]|nr:L-aspartate oxidase [Planctomycetota bacterium]